MDEVEQEIQKPVVVRLLSLMKFRSNYAAFDGDFELNNSNDSSVAMAWRHGDYYCHLFVDLNFNTVKIDYYDLDTCQTEALVC
jgi:sucrose phosphorylase